MLQFLQTGKVLYVLAAVCGIGIVSKLVTGSLYKRLIKETGNMALTKNKNLRSLKQKTENMFLLSQGIRNPGAYIERQMYGFRFMNMSLDNWDNLSVQAMILCFMIGGIAAFGAYWYRCDSYYIVLYGTMGILSGLSLVFIDNGVNTSGKRQQLADYLVDYVENSPHFYRPVDKSMDSTDPEKRSRNHSGSSRFGFREIERMGKKAKEEAAVSEESGLAAGNAKGSLLTAGMAAGDMQLSEVQASGTLAEDAKTVKTHGERQGRRFSVLSRKTDSRESEFRQQTDKPLQKISGREDELARSIDYLKQSLEQIAASREMGKREQPSVRQSEEDGLEKAKKELKPEDLKLLGEILQEYLT